MLTECPECTLQVSDKAITCPHCGYPLKPSVQPSANSYKKHMRLPNGFGQITRIKGKNMRNCYRAMVTVGKTEYGKPICKLLKPRSYFESYNEAYKALVEYNKNPYDFNKDISFDELHTIWIESNSYDRLSATSKRSYEQAWKYCSNISYLLLSELRLRVIRMCIDDVPTLSMKKLVKVVITRLLDYAVQYEYIDKNIMRDFKLEDDAVTVKKDHIAFTDEEMNILWQNKHVAYVDWILIQCYTGLRPQELCNMKVNDVNINERIMVGGMKTKAGKDRIIPIHEAIVRLVEKNKENAYKCESEYLICRPECKHLTYNQYNYRFETIIKLLELNHKHRPHDPRKQFVTMCKKYNVDEYAIKRIVGHAISDLTENIYTERDVAWLVSEINRINVRMK